MRGGAASNQNEHEKRGRQPLPYDPFLFVFRRRARGPVSNSRWRSDSCARFEMSRSQRRRKTKRMSIRVPSPINMAPLRGFENNTRPHGDATLHSILLLTFSTGSTRNGDLVFKV